LLADENFPLPVVEALRSYAHDVVTLAELQRAGRRMSDAEVLAAGRTQHRAILTLDRRDFFRLHREQPDHEGIIACTFDPDFAGQTGRIHAALAVQGELRGVLLRVNRPSK
jgi:predicted nuclease of predicted toxin-antitoxin system